MAPPPRRRDLNDSDRFTPSMGSDSNERRGRKHKGLPFIFVAIPRDVLNSPEYIALPASAKALLFDIAVAYNGKNNGRIAVSVASPHLKARGWTSWDKLSRAKKALEGCRFYVTTRKGHPPSTVEWVGLTWWPLAHDRSMDIGPRDWPFLNFVRPTNAVGHAPRSAGSASPSAGTTDG